MLRIPSESKIYTTIYDSFKGVDFTNDPTNVWRKRSPEAVNMMPDESGRPFKRAGWEIEIPVEAFAIEYYNTKGFSVDEITIRRCYYFELAGLDHIVVFTNVAVFICRQTVGGESDDGTEIELLTDDADAIDSAMRAFFFEGGGTAAFFIYGGYKIWRYQHENGGFTFGEVEAYIPTIRVAVTPQGEGQLYEPVNLFSGKYTELFQNNLYSEGVYKVSLISKIDLSQYEEVDVYVSRDKAFDTKLTVVTSRSQLTGSSKCLLVSENDETHIEFYQSEQFIDGEDSIKVTYPRNEVVYTPHVSSAMTVTAEILG